MIKEYAIEPEAVADWQRLRYFADQCGVSRGRVIARFPDDWADRVYRHALRKLLDQNDLKRVEVKLAQLRHGRSFVNREEASFDGQRDWIENAVVEHALRPFQAIVTEANSSAHSAMIEADAVHAGDPRWAATTCLTIKRVAPEFARVTAPLMAISREVLLVDPYFTPERLEFRNVLAAIARRVCLRRTRRFEYHYCSQEGAAPFSESAQRWLPPLIPAGLTLDLMPWPLKRFHNRYVLTEDGGLAFGHGLSEAVPRQEPADEVALLSDESHVKRWDEFGRRGLDSRRSAVSIVGTRRL